MLTRGCSKRVNALCCERFWGICKADRLGLTGKYGYPSRSIAADTPKPPQPGGLGLRTKIGSSTFSVVHCGGDVEFTDGEVEHGD